MALSDLRRLAATFRRSPPGMPAQDQVGAAPPAPEPPGAPAATAAGAVAALKLQIEWGADEALCEQPVVRLRGAGGLPRAEVPAAPPERLWPAELAVLMAFTPGQRITDPVRAAQYFAGEAHRVLDQARAEPDGAARLMARYRRRGVGGLSANSTPPPRPWICRV